MGTPPEKCRDFANSWKNFVPTFYDLKALNNGTVSSRSLLSDFEKELSPLSQRSMKKIINKDFESYIRTERRKQHEAGNDSLLTAYGFSGHLTQHDRDTPLTLPGKGSNTVVLQAARPQVRVRSDPGLLHQARQLL